MIPLPLPVILSHVRINTAFLRFRHSPKLFKELIREIGAAPNSTY